MRKVLLGTTAMVAAGMLASAPSAIAAEKLKLGVSGYMEQWFGYSAQDGVSGQDFSGFNQISDAEVFFKGSTELDNGLTVGVDVQLEGNTGGDQIDESYMWINGSFGQFILGSENTAQYKMGYGPSDFGIGLISGDQPSWVTPVADADGDKINLTGKGYWRNPMGSSSWVEVLGMNDTQGVSYYTPRFQGVQIGLTYTPDVSAGEDNGSMPNRDKDNADAISAGVNYKQSFDNASVGASLTYGTVTRTMADDDSDPSALSMGLTVGVGGFGIGASYAAFDDSGVKNGEGYAVGANYATGPWGLSLTYFHGERDGTMMDDMLMDQAALNTVHLSAKYALGPGVTAKGTLGHASIESDDTAIDESVDDISATYLVVGVAVSY
ncbi:MAG: porin [Alphaproteobacteria bacterium]|nr:porin [Alphaproteobacteria bacterium]